MLFRAMIVDPVTKAHKCTGFKLDPWEQELGQRNDVIPGLGSIDSGVWIQMAWPAFVYNNLTLKEIGHVGEYTLFRRAIDQERGKRWDRGERFQVTSYTE